MGKKIKKIQHHLKNNRGDIYIQMLICTVIFLFVGAVIFSMASSVTTKLWLDEKMNDIAKHVANDGTIYSDEITALETQITNRLGGTITYTGTFIDDDFEKGLVQLNDKVYIHYHNDEYVACHFGEFKISTEINLYQMAISKPYFKTEDPLID